LLVFWVVPYSCVVWWETLKGLNHLYRAPVFIFIVYLAWLLSPVLVIWCNAVLVLEARRERHNRAASKNLVATETLP
jgi:uncharacterized membrane protein